MSQGTVHIKIYNTLIPIIFKKILLILLIENANQTCEVKCYSLHSLLLLCSALAQAALVSQIWWPTTCHYFISLSR